MPITVPVAAVSQSVDTQGTKMKKSYLAVIAVVVVIIILLYHFRSQFVVATVNGQPISRTAYNSELEKAAGKKTMSTLVTKTLVLQEAAKRNISVSDQDVTDQVKKIQDQLSKQGQNLNQALAMQGMAMSDLKDQIKIEKLIEKLLGKQIQVSDQEVSDYMQKMQQANTGTDSAAVPQMSKDQVRQQLQQQKLSQKAQPWLADLQAKAKISYFISQ